MEENEFTFSISKTKAIHFTIKQGMYLPPELKLYKETAVYVDSCKFFRLIWNSKLTWHKHNEKIRCDCTKVLNLMKPVTTHDWGTNMQCSLLMYRMVIKGRFDYGAIVYNSASPTALRKLDPIQSEALRIATGALRSSLMDSLSVLTNEMPTQD